MCLCVACNGSGIDTGYTWLPARRIRFKPHDGHHRPRSSAKFVAIRIHSAGSGRAVHAWMTSNCAKRM